MVELFQLVQGIRYLYGDQGEKEVKIGHCINGSIQRRQGSGHLLSAKDALSREVLMAQSEYGYDYSSEIWMKSEDLMKWNMMRWYVMRWNARGCDEIEVRLSYAKRWGVQERRTFHRLLLFYFMLMNWAHSLKMICLYYNMIKFFNNRIFWDLTAAVIEEEVRGEVRRIAL